MKTYHLDVTRRAEQDADAIFDWLAERSPEGAARWYQKLRETLIAVMKKPTGHSFAPEADCLGLELRQSLFKTRHGRPYRALFLVEPDAVKVLAVRGSGQDDVTWGDLE